MKTQSQKICKISAWILANNGLRFVVLAAAAVCGFGLWRVVTLYMPSLLSGNESFAAWVQIFLLSVFVLIMLWWFRTYDTKEQITKTKEQIEQSARQFHEQGLQDDYFKGLENLASDNSLKIDIGINALTGISKKTDKFNEQIRMAFIQRLKYLPVSHNQDPAQVPVPAQVPASPKTNLAYAQYIFRWLIEYQDQNPNKEKPDLHGMSCQYQVFDIHNFKGRKFPLNKILPTVDEEQFSTNFNFWASFIGANCKGLDFSDVLVDRYNFVDATNVNLIGAYCSKKGEQELHYIGVNSTGKPPWAARWMVETRATHSSDYLKILPDQSA